MKYEWGRGQIDPPLLPEKTTLKNPSLIRVKTEDVYKDIANDVEKRFDTSNYAIERPLPKGKNKKVIGLMKDELDGKIMAGLVGLRPKTYSYLIDDGNCDKKAKGTKNV